MNEEDEFVLGKRLEVPPPRVQRAAALLTVALTVEDIVHLAQIAKAAGGKTLEEVAQDAIRAYRVGQKDSDG